MKLILQNGEEVKVETPWQDSYKCDDGKFHYDSEIKRIEDDIRLGEYYTSSVGHGTYEEVKKAIDERRTHINECKNCYWHYKRTRVEEECKTEKRIEGDREITDTHTVYIISCGYGNGCCYDVPEEPILFREKYPSFFTEHPEGVPDQTRLIEFIEENAEKFDVRVRGYVCSTYIYSNKKFGTYELEIDVKRKLFRLRNSRNNFFFYLDLDNQNFIYYNSYMDGLQYQPCLKDNDGKTMVGFDKFKKWLDPIIEEFRKVEKI